MPVGRPPREDVVVLLVVWVLPLGAVVALLWSVGLGRLAGALLLVELLVGLAVALARRRPAGRTSGAGGDGAGARGDGPAG